MRNIEYGIFEMPRRKNPILSLSKILCCESILLIEVRPSARASGFGEELLGIEILIAAPHGVDGMQQLAHQRDDRLQLGLAPREEALDESAGFRAAAGGGERRIEQRLAQAMVAALADPRLTLDAAARALFAHVDAGLGHP